MKKILIIATTMAIVATGNLMAQEKTTLGQDIKNAGKKIGNKTGEIASKGAAKIVDRAYKDKVGPNGETIYIDKHAKYYFVDEKGKHVYVEANELKEKIKK